MGVLVSAYGPLLEILARRFDVSLSVAGGVLSAHFAGSLAAVIVSMRALRTVSGRTFASVALGCLGLGCALAAVAPSWPVFLTGVVVIGAGFGALDIGFNQLVAYRDGPRRVPVLNAVNGGFAIGAVAGPLVVSRAGEAQLTLIYACAGVVAVALIPAAAGISGRPPVASRGAARTPGLLLGLFALAFVLYVGTETGVGGWMTSHLESLGIRSIAAAELTSGFWLALAVGRIAIAAVPARVPEPAIVLAGCAVGAIALLCAHVSQLAATAYIVTGVAIAPIFPTGIAWLARLRPGDARATSWMFPASMLGGAIVPGGISAVVARVGLGWVPTILAAVAIGCLTAFALAARSASPRRDA